MTHIASLLMMVVCQADSGNSDLLKYIKVANEANIESFVRGRIEFDVLRSDKSGAGDLSDRRLEGMEKAKGLLLFNSRDALLRIEYDDGQLIKGTRNVGENQQTMALTSRTLLTDGSSTLLDSPAVDTERGVVTNSPEVYPDKGYDFFRQYAKFLYPVGSNNIVINRLASDIQDVLNGDASVKDVHVDERAGDRGKFARFTITKKPGFTRDYTVDLDKGAIPVLIKNVGKDGSLTTEMLWGDLKHVPDAGWFPCTFRVNLPRANISEIYVVTALDFAMTPRDDDFTVQFKAPVSFTDRVTSTLQRNAREYSLIKRTKSPPKNSVKVRLNGFTLPSGEGGMPGELSAPSYLRYFLLAGLIGVLALGVRKFVKRDPKRHGSSG